MQTDQAGNGVTTLFPDMAGTVGVELGLRRHLTITGRENSTFVSRLQSVMRAEWNSNHRFKS